MRVQLQLPDDIYDSYARHAQQLTVRRNGAQEVVSAEDMMVATLDRFRRVAPADRVVVIDSANREKLEKLLSGGFIRDGADLYQKVQQLAVLEIGEVRVFFTVKQLDQIKNYATRNRISVEAAVTAVVRGMEEQFFDIAG